MAKQRVLGEPDAPKGPPPTIKAGRQSRSRYQGYIGMLPLSSIPRRRFEQVDVTKLENADLSACQLLALLPDLSPDVGLATWNMLRLGSRGFNYTAKDAQGQDDETGKALLDVIASRVNLRYGGLRGMIIQWLMTGFLQGAVAGEVALTDGLNDIDDFYPLDPNRIDARLNPDGDIVDYFIPITGGPIEMNPLKFWYVPIDTPIDDPYGRAPAAPALQEVWFDISLITDLRKVVHNQGWPRIDIKLLQETIIDKAPTGIKNDPVKLQEFLDLQLKSVVTAYNNLQPDDSFVHYDSVEIDGSDTSGKLFDSVGIIRAIERRLIKALKQLPILMASNEGTTESHGTVQWEIFVAGLVSLQDPIAFILQQMFSLALRVQGYQATVECWFEPIRTTDRKADADAEAVEIKNAITKFLAGFQTWEESAIEITGSGPPPDAPEPDRATLAAIVGGGFAQPQPEPGPQAQLDPDARRLDSELKHWQEED